MRDADADSSGFARRPLDRNSQHGAPLPGIHRYGTALIAAGNKDKAKTFFRMNRERHPEEKFVTYVGPARGYTALGDTKNAIANWEIALENIPESQKANLPAYEQALRALKEKGERRRAEHNTRPHG